MHTRAAQQSLISYVKTFEEQPGSPQLKARFLILAGTSPSTRSPRSRLSRPHSPAAQQDGSCKIHKAKQNPNGSFSIGKTWELHDLQRVQVGKVKQPASLSFPVHDTLRGTDKSSPCHQRLIAGRPHVSHLKTSRARLQNAHAVPPPPLRSQSSSRWSSTTRRTATIPNSPPHNRPSSSSPSSDAGGNTWPVRFHSCRHAALQTGHARAHD